MAKRPLKRRLIPYKVLATLEHGNFSWIDRDPTGVLEFRLGPLSRELRISVTRVKESLAWLYEEAKLLEWAVVQRGRATVLLKHPKRGES